MAVNDDWKFLLHLEEELCTKLNDINFFAPPSKIAFIYNPIDYAIELHLDFITRFFRLPKKVLFVGMNPGPFGMAQTGVPFGDVVTVRDWLRIKGSLGKLPHVHQKRPILGLNCTRTEVSGMRFWGLFWKTLKLSPDEFFKNCFVLNICPLLFLDANGKNISLSDVIAPIRRQVESLCNEFLIKILKLMKPEIIVGVGHYSMQKIQRIIPILKMQSEMAVHEHIHTNLTDGSKTPPLADDNKNLATGELNDQPTSKSTETNSPLKIVPDHESTVDNGSHMTPKLVKLMHPSPANPMANRGWDEIALEQLKEFGILHYFVSK